MSGQAWFTNDALDFNASEANPQSQVHPPRYSPSEVSNPNYSPVTKPVISHTSSPSASLPYLKHVYPRNTQSTTIPFNGLGSLDPPKRPGSFLRCNTHTSSPQTGLDAYSLLCCEAGTRRSFAMSLSSFAMQGQFLAGRDKSHY